MRKNTFWGLLLIILGTLAIANKFYNLDFISIGNLWPLFLLIPGLSFEFKYFSTKRDAGVLVPGGILTTLGILFLFENFTNWNFAIYTWPIYPLAVAIGLFQLYLFGGKNNGLLIPVFILGGVSIMGILKMLYGNVLYWIDSSLFLPIIFIALGLYILFKNYIK